MYLYLVRHGEQVSVHQDPSQPLSEKGAADVEKVARFLSGIMIDRICHSFKLRAEETAEIFSQVFGIEPSSVEGLQPGDDPMVWAINLEEMNEDTMLIGHLPHLNRLASLLLARDADLEFLDFKPGSVACLVSEDVYGPRPWNLRWMIKPDLITT